MINRRDASNLFGDAVRREMFRGWREMFTGRRVTANVVTLEGAPAGKTWVRPSKASWEAIAVLGVASQVDAKVWVGPDISGHDRIYYVSEDTFFEFGDKGHLVLSPPISGKVNVLEVMGQNFVPGRLVPDPDSGPMHVKVEPFAHPSGLFDGPAIDLTAYLPVTAGMNAWIAVAADPATNTLTAYTGDETWLAPKDMPEADAFAIDIPAGLYPAGAIALAENTIEITAGARIVDLRRHLSAPSAPLLDDLANVNSAGKADGDTLMWDEDADEWIPGAGGGGGSIVVTDGTTSVDPTGALAFDPAFFAVADNGGKEAEVTFLGGGGAPVQKATALLNVEEVVADVTLSADGTFDVSNIPSDYDDLRIVLVTRAAAATTGVNNLWTFNGDTNNANYQVQVAAINNVLAAVVNGASRLWSVTVADTGTANFWTEIHTHIPLYASTTRFKALHMDGADPRGAPNNQWRLVYTGIWKSTAAINRIQIAADNANPNFKAGSRLRIFGVRQRQVVTDVTGGGAVDTSTANVSNPPTAAELDSALGTPTAVGAGYQCLIDDGGADANVYLVTSNGTSWWYMALTKAT